MVFADFVDVDTVRAQVAEAIKIKVNRGVSDVEWAGTIPTPKGDITLKQWAGIYASGVKLTKIIAEQSNWPVISENYGKGLNCHCPYEASHSTAHTEGDSSFVVFHHSDRVRGFGIKCQHSSCKADHIKDPRERAKQERTRIDFVGQALENGWLDPATLTDPAFFVDGFEPDLSNVGHPFSEDFAKGAATTEEASREARIKELMAQMVLHPKHNYPVPNVYNAQLVLDMHPDFEGCFAYDTFTERKILTRPIPGSRTPCATFKGRAFEDTDYTDVRRWFERHGFATIRKEVVVEAVNGAFRQATFNALTSYIDGLPSFDPITDTPRLETWLHDMGGVEVTGDEAQDTYVREVGKRWLMSAVARAIHPGCKVDAMIVLEGKQGTLKSTLLRTLAGDDWFGDALPPVKSKDAKDYVRGKWIIEHSELAALTKAEVEDIKAYTSRQEEKYRPAYGREERQYKRQCVFAGTTNRSDYLRDETGNRRFWPIKVTGHINIVDITKHRDALFAEAAYYVSKGEPWWLPDDVAATAAAEASARYNEDPWQAAVQGYCETKAEVCVSEILYEALFVERGRQSRAESNRVAAVLRAIGYTQDGQISAGDYKGAKRFKKTNASAQTQKTRVY